MSGFQSSQAGRPPWRNTHSRERGRETAQQPGLACSRHNANAWHRSGMGSSLGTAGVAPESLCQPEGANPTVPFPDHPPLLCGRLGGLALTISHSAQM